MIRIVLHFVHVLLDQVPHVHAHQYHAQHEEDEPHGQRDAAEPARAPGALNGALAVAALHGLARLHALEDGEDADEPAAVFHLLKNAVQNGGQHIDLVDREVVVSAKKI